jgi:2-oxoacid:acceptor oxidoreductase gamma subunit (pyruvate/2-ketoisovalerate family)
MLSIVFHGRGGQGAVTAAELLAVAVSFEGKFSQAFPLFGVERRGAPVTAFCRIDNKPIRVHQQIYEPDIVVVLDKTLIEAVDVLKGLREGGTVIVNSKNKPGVRAKRVYFVDATEIALKHVGAPIVNTAMLGAFSKATKLVKLNSIKKAIEEHFAGDMAEKNKKAVEECYNSLR